MHGSHIALTSVSFGYRFDKSSTTCCVCADSPHSASERALRVIDTALRSIARARAASAFFCWHFPNIALRNAPSAVYRAATSFTLLLKAVSIALRENSLALLSCPPKEAVWVCQSNPTYRSGWLLTQSRCCFIVWTSWLINAT